LRNKNDSLRSKINQDKTEIISSDKNFESVQIETGILDENGRMGTEILNVTNVLRL